MSCIANGTDPGKLVSREVLSQGHWRFFFASASESTQVLAWVSGLIMLFFFCVKPAQVSWVSLASHSGQIHVQLSFRLPLAGLALFVSKFSSVASAHLGIIWSMHAKPSAMVSTSSWFFSSVVVFLGFVLWVNAGCNQVALEEALVASPSFLVRFVVPSDQTGLNHELPEALALVAPFCFPPPNQARLNRSASLTSLPRLNQAVGNFSSGWR